MRSLSFTAELGINPQFDPENNDAVSVLIGELGSKLQEYAAEVESETGIYISTIVKGPNRSCYKTSWGAPDGGELSYSIHGCSDHRLQLRPDPFDTVEWKKAVLLLVDRVKTCYGQAYVLVEFLDHGGVDSYLLGPEYGPKEAALEILR